MNNPFYFGRIVRGDSFVDREQEFKGLCANLSRGQSTILFSPRRYGKTSLIKKALREIQNPHLLTFYIDFYRITSLDQFYSHYSRTVLGSLRPTSMKLFEIVRGLIPSLRPKLVYAEPNMPSIEVEMGLDIFKQEKTLQELFDLVEKYCAKKKVKACIAFDEFQEIVSIDPTGRLEREMRSCFQHHRFVSYAFLGSKLHLMNQLFKDKKRPFYNFGTRMELDVISVEAWIPFIQNGFQQGGWRIDIGLCREIVQITRGHPYYTQMLCSEVWDLAESGNIVTKENVVSALNGVLSNEGHAFQELWDSLDTKERILLSAMAEESSYEIFSTDFLVKYNLGAASSIQRIAEKLIKRGVVEKKAGKIRIVDPILVYWLRREDLENE